MNSSAQINGSAQPDSYLNCRSYIFTLESGLYSLQLRKTGNRTKAPFAVAFFTLPKADAQAGFLSLSNAPQSSVVLTSESPTALCQVTGGEAQLYINEYNAEAAVTGDRSIVVSLLDLDAGAAKLPAGPAIVGISEIVTPAAVQPPPGPTLSVTVQTEGAGERVYAASEWAGGYDRTVKLEGFTLALAGQPAGLNLEYQCGNAELGLTPWVKGGRYCGTRGKGVALTKFAVRLSGPGADDFDVEYRGHFIGYGDSHIARNGEICQATANQPLAAISVEILSKAAIDAVRDSVADPAAADDPDRAKFDEQEYLRLYPDVSTSVSLREIESGYAHYVSFGRAEGRRAPRLSSH